MRTVMRAFSGMMLLALVVTGPGCADDDVSADAAPMIDADPLAPDADLLPFASECTTNDMCESGLCFPFNMDGPHCTIECPMAPATCPAPSSGCNGMGVCKID